MNKIYTREQMKLWGQFNLVFGVLVLSLMELWFQIVGPIPLDWIWHSLVSVVFLVVVYFYHRLYQKTKEI